MNILERVQLMHANRLARKVSKQKGASMIEYAILIGVVVGAAAVFGPKLTEMLTDVFDKASTNALEAMDSEPTTTP